MGSSKEPSTEHSASGRAHVRNRRLVDRYFQVRMLRRSALPLLLSTAIVGAGIAFVTTGERNFSSSELRWSMVGGLVVLNLVSLGGVAWSLMLYSSRVAGPLVNLRRTLEGVSSGDLTIRARVRKDDELQEHAEHLNSAIVSLQDRVKRINQFCTYTRTTIEDMKQSDPGSAQLARLLDLVKSIEESVGDFRV